jgi:probable rRNA maturation factor
VRLELTLQNPAGQKKVPKKKKFEEWVTGVLKEMDHTKTEHSEIVIRIVNKEESATLNYSFRKKNGPTNILSFTYDTHEEPYSNSLGDLAICAEIVMEEAETQKKDVQAHWAHLTIHGTLHLLGYDHERESDAIEMEQLETKILFKLGYPNPYEHQVIPHHD